MQESLFGRLSDGKVVFGRIQWEFVTGSSGQLAEGSLHHSHGLPLQLHHLFILAACEASWFRPGGLICDWWAAVNIHIHIHLARPACPVFDSSSGSEQLVLHFLADADTAAHSSIAPGRAPIRRTFATR